jgi:hypothetical protein
MEAESAGFPLQSDRNSTDDGSAVAAKGITKVKFSHEEDDRLRALVEQYGTKSWKEVAHSMETRNARQCRERYNNYLKPDLRQDDWKTEEDLLLERKYMEYGGKWNKISRFFLNRSDLSLRNRWMILQRRRAKGVPSVCGLQNVLMAREAHRGVVPPPRLILPVFLPQAKGSADPQPPFVDAPLRMRDILPADGDACDHIFDSWERIVSNIN